MDLTSLGTGVNPKLRYVITILPKILFFPVLDIRMLTHPNIKHRNFRKFYFHLCSRKRQQAQNSIFHELWHIFVAAHRISLYMSQWQRSTGFNFFYLCLYELRGLNSWSLTKSESTGHFKHWVTGPSSSPNGPNPTEVLTQHLTNPAVNSKPVIEGVQFSVPVLYMCTLWYTNSCTLQYWCIIVYRISAWRHQVYSLTTWNQHK